MHRSRASSLGTLGSVLTAVLLATNAPAQDGFWIADKLEVQVKPPSRWTFLGSEGDRGCLRAMYCAPREYQTKAGEQAPHTPTMRILWFAKANAEAAGKNKSAAGWPLRSTYADTADYLARSHGKGRTDVSVEADKFGKFDGRRHVVEFPELFGGITLHLCSIPLDQGELVVEFEVLTEQYKRMKGSFEKSFSSLAATPEDKLKPRTEVETPKWIADFEGWQAMPLGKRIEHREAWGQRWLQRKKEENNPGFKVSTSTHFLVLSRTDSKYTKRIVQAADASRTWVAKRFAKVSDDLVMPAVLRIFDSRREEATYRLREQNVIEYHSGRREFYAFKDASIGNLGDGYGRVVRGVLQHHLHDKHHKILENLPRWLDNGLWGYTEGSRVVKGKKLIFFPHDVEMKRFQYLADNNQPQNTWWFMQDKMFDTPKDGSPEPEWDYKFECTRLLRWFDEGGSAFFKHDDLLVDYLAQVGKTGLSFRPRPDANVDWAEVPEDRVKVLQSDIYDRRDKFLVAVNTGVIPISPDAWREADKLWQAYNVEFAKRKFKKK